MNSTSGLAGHFGRSITIKTKSEFKFIQSPELVNRVLQEDVSIILPETSK